MVPAARCSKGSGPFMQFMDDGARCPNESWATARLSAPWPPLTALGPARSRRGDSRLWLWLVAAASRVRGRNPRRVLEPSRPRLLRKAQARESGGSRKVSGRTETWGRGGGSGCRQEGTVRSVFREQASKRRSETRVGRDPFSPPSLPKYPSNKDS